MQRSVIWQGKVGNDGNCDACGEEISDIFYDAKTRTGQWGCLCPMCFSRYGIGLGQGRGQKYEWDGKAYQKVEG